MYATVRAKLSRRLLGFAETPFNYMIASSTYALADAPGIEPPPAPSPLQQRFGTAIWRLEALRVYRPWVYGLIGVVACVLAAALRRWWPCAVALSGLLTEALLFLVAPAPEYRCSYWMIVSALIATTWLTVECVARALRAAQRVSA